MTNNFISGFNLFGHFSTTTNILFPFLIMIFLGLSQLLPLVYMMENAYGKEHSYDYRANLPTSDVMYDNKSQIFGKSYKDWTAEWWKWAYSIPLNKNPAYDVYGINCNINQYGPVWFLDGTFNHSANRSCLIPDNIGILFPILNSECSYIEYPLIKNEDGLMECAQSIQNHVNHLNATLDDRPLLNLDEYRIQSPLFNFSLPANNFLNLTKGEISAAISDGNWVFLKPLTVGKHTITFEGGFSNTSKERNGVTNESMSFGLPIGWDYETRYDLLVIPSHSYINNKNFTYSSGGLISTNISIGEILKQNLIQLQKNLTNNYQSIKYDTILDYLTKSDGWKALGDSINETQNLSKVFIFDSFPKSVKFSYMVSELAQMLNHHPIIHIDRDKVTLVLNTWALNNSTSNFDLGFTILSDQLYELAIKDNL
ncbi:pterin-4-alpha-carbinolamine dehydratase [Candidatus Nitrosocosmicus oleophilus]|uniref:4a-hydroxytetrahydrobiopterin dehydratase n=1 Tax=Candidatus Nitrosocosmicus oleophilus TaxID=1353260 RepID=A0A654M3L2_9ARCH|nr:4a-hydroxytetrahydrobiopterin dehydratase [Candidatus Nitrosocosmicus oleophilus]ALI37273.1 pterin-4-alpha-carbinolamine dehydratase [Candidatus Nitrosocosmicus oleophilus]